MTNLPTRQTDESVVAYKVACFQNIFTKTFRGLQGVTYTTDDHAVCTYFEYPKSEIPHLDIHKMSHHRCGFYALHSLKMALNLAYEESLIDVYKVFIPIQVELSGKVIRYTTGYRASQQKVTKILLPSQCMTSIMKHSLGKIRNNVSRKLCGKPTELAAQYGAASGIGPSCLDCAELYKKGSRTRTYSINQLSRQVHIPVEICPPLVYPQTNYVDFTEFF